MNVQRGEKSFYIGDEHAPDTEMTYVPSGEKLITIDSTHVSESMKGQGAGKQLLTALTDWARKEGLKIIPLCPYAKAQMEKNPVYHDLIHRQ